MANAYGYSKIINVVVQQDVALSPCGDGLYTEVIEFGIVWLETEDGIFEVMAKVGETEEELAAHYRKSGWTNDRCVFFK